MFAVCHGNQSHALVVSFAAMYCALMWCINPHYPRGLCRQMGYCSAHCQWSNTEYHGYLCQQLTAKHIGLPTMAIHQWCIQYFHGNPTNHGNFMGLFACIIDDNCIKRIHRHLPKWGGYFTCIGVAEQQHYHKPNPAMTAWWNNLEFI